jgi:hypothetical protein
MNSEQNPIELLIWIYEDHQRQNINDAPFGSGDMDALEEGIHDLVESLFHWKEKKNQFFEIDLSCDITEEGAGILKCLDAMTGEPRPFPTEWLKENEGKMHVLNDPEKMEPLLKLYSNPWKYLVQVCFTKKETSPSESSLNEETLKKREDYVAKQENLINEALEKLKIPLDQDAKDVLAELIEKMKELGPPPL